MTRMFLIVHGSVQGVGYRSFVRDTAMKYKIKGFVRNSAEGYVEILAEADDPVLEAFIKEIKIDVREGPQVYEIGLDEESLKKYNGKEYKEFSIDWSG